MGNRIIRSLCCLALVVTLALPGALWQAHAADTAVGGLTYRVNDDGRTATVTGYSKAPSGKLSIPATVTLAGKSYAVSSVGARAFADCPALTAVTAPSVVTIGEQAFYSCGALREASFPAAATVGELAFMCCTGLVSVSFPKATALERQSFAYSGLTAIPKTSFPSVKTIGPAAFYYCISNGEASFPAATSIGTGAFVRNGLAKADFPNAVQVGSMAFLDNRRLPEVVLADEVRLGHFAFQGCYALRTARFMGSAVFGQQVFTSCSREFTIQYPQDAREAWVGWSNPEKYRLAEWS